MSSAIILSAARFLTVSTNPNRLKVEHVLSKPALSQTLNQRLVDSEESLTSQWLSRESGPVQGVET
jgi:hypothetical protein